jgi:hypothetical protein
MEDQLTAYFKKNVNVLCNSLHDIMTLYHSLGTFLQSLKIVYIYMHSALTGVHVLVTHTPEHANWLAYFYWSLLIVTAEKGQATEISYWDARSLVIFFRGFILWQQETCFCVWLWYKRERTSKHSAIWLILGATPSRTNQIASCFDALSITYSE